MTKINESNALKLETDDMITIENSLEFAYQNFMNELNEVDHEPGDRENIRIITRTIEKTLSKVKLFLDAHASDLVSDNSNRLVHQKPVNRMIEKKDDDDEWQ